MLSKKIILTLCGVLVVGAVTTMAMNNNEVNIAKQQSAVIATDATQAQAESAINDTKTSSIVVDSNTNNQAKDAVSNKVAEKQKQALDIINSTQNTANASSNDSDTQSEDQANELLGSTENL